MAFKDFVEDFCTPSALTAPSPAALQHFETESPKGYTTEQVVAKLNDKAEQEIRSLLAHEIQVYHFRVCRSNTFYSNLQLATRSQQPLITSFLPNLLDFLATQADGEMRHGTAPPSATERALREIIDRLGGSRDRE